VVTAMGFKPPTAPVRGDRLVVLRQGGQGVV
jgi:hypothetical protein